jgi:hypothetical protein
MDLSLKKATHRVIVNAIYYKDVKTFSISTDDPNTAQILKDFVKDKLKYILEEKIIFTNQRKGKTHRICLLDMKNRSKTISVKYPSYSSYEIANELHQFLCGGKKL